MGFDQRVQRAADLGESGALKGLLAAGVGEPGGVEWGVSGPQRNAQNDAEVFDHLRAGPGSPFSRKLRWRWETWAWLASCSWLYQW